VLQARYIQYQRQGKANGALQGSELKQLCRLGVAEQQLLQSAMDRLNLSVRGYHRVLRVARTIADLHSAETLNTSHIAEALGYRFAAN
jgi:magnesium chelatase family protein